MIILSQALVLSPGAVLLSTPIFGWKNLVTPGNISATSEDVEHPAANLANPSTALRWKAALQGSPLGPPISDTFLTAAINSVEEVDYLAVAVHNFGTIGSILSVEGSIGGSPTWFELVAESIQANNDPILFRFTPQALTSIRLRIQPSPASPLLSTDPPFCAVMYVGKLLVLERGTHTDHTPINLARQSRVMTGRSEAGNFLGRVILSEERATSLALQRLGATWYRDNMDEFIAAAKADPFFFAWKPQEHSADVGYCWMTNDPQPSRHFETGTMALTLNMSGVTI